LSQSVVSLRRKICPLLDKSGQRSILARDGLSANDAVDGARSAASKCYDVVALK
jgi:hypothetical protein